MTWRRPLCILFLAAVALTPSCLCSGYGHVDQAPFRAQAGHNLLNCNCNLSFKHPACPGGTCLAHQAIPLCMPPSLRRTAGTPDGGAAPDGGQDDYAGQLDAYCRGPVTNLVYHLIRVVNDSWCDYKAAFTPDGYIGQSVECFAQPIDSGQGLATASAATCASPCPDLECTYDNCGAQVQDSSGIHLEKCLCNQVLDRSYSCPGDPVQSLPTVRFCRPPPDEALSF